MLQLIGAGFASGVATTIINWLSAGATIITILAAIQSLGAGAGLVAAVRTALQKGLTEKAIAL